MANIPLEGDRVLIDGKKLSGPLRPHQRIELPRGYIAHNDVIGKHIRSHIPANTGQLYHVTYPDLDQYVSLTPRKVTPVYATYASLIVSLLDFNFPAPTIANEDEAPLEILEAGTGHGALTLHLARAVHAANPAPPYLPPKSRVTLDQTSCKDGSEQWRLETDDQADWEAYRCSRRAIIHSVELSPAYSAHAEKLVRGFRKGMYAPHVEFYVANISDWIASQIEARRKILHKETDPFLSYVLLDMPGSYLQIEKVAKTMKDGALLVVFVPSVTQIGDCVRAIQQKQLPLKMENVLELGEGISNGRVWDVRLFKKRAKAAVKVIESSEGSNAEALHEHLTCEEPKSDGEPAILGEGNEDDTPVMVCRPKVGRLVIGGGFLGLWRKIDTTK